mgnify:CR=1 FL=1|tara:strand:+ start:842 stop:1849 length:1008 start_codon:yes stop_codon:yes gene_type:complete
MSSEEAMKAAVQSTFEQHQKEIKRRSEINQQGFIDDKKFSKVADATDFKLKIEDQKFIVFSLSQTEFAPISVNKKNPAICIYGAFQTREEAIEYAKESVLKEHPTISIFVDETHKWVAAVKNVKCLSENYVNQHVDALLKKHQEIIHTNTKDFKENVAEQKTGTTTKKEEKEKEENEISETKGKAHKISNRLDVRNQKLAVVSFVKDEAEIPEFLFRVYALFDKEDDANSYIRNVCGDNVEDFDIDVVSACEWIFPQTMTYENANKEVFRSEELDRIMKNHKNQPKEVAKFNEAMAKDEKETSQNDLVKSIEDKESEHKNNVKSENEEQSLEEID